MFAYIQIAILVTLVISLIINILLADRVDNADKRLKKVRAAYVDAYRDIAYGELPADVLEALLRNIDRDLNN